MSVLSREAVHGLNWASSSPQLNSKIAAGSASGLAGETARPAASADHHLESTGLGHEARTPPLTQPPAFAGSLRCATIGRMTKQSCKDADLAAGLDLEGMVVAGTEPAYEALGPYESVYCVCCGAQINFVLLTNKGPMGGDCYATLSGDNTTRRVWRKLGQKLDYAMHVEESRYHHVTQIGVEHGVGIFHGGSVLTAYAPGQRSWLLGVIPARGLAEAIGAALAEQHGLDLAVREDS